MAHHLSTPFTVLTAPHLTPRVVVSHAGLSRAERRHPERVSPKRRLATFGHRNVPFVGKVRDLVAD